MSKKNNDSVLFFTLWVLGFRRQSMAWSHISKVTHGCHMGV